jgi:hypothetical protein
VVAVKDAVQCRLVGRDGYCHFLASLGEDKIGGAHAVSRGDAFFKTNSMGITQLKLSCREIEIYE